MLFVENADQVLNDSWLVYVLEVGNLILRSSDSGSVQIRRSYPFCRICGRRRVIWDQLWIPGSDCQTFVFT
jgi:hypothetical protein